MNSAIERLLTLTVGDVMTREQIVEISPNQTLDEAAEMMARKRISGAPVVDELGHCIGILSAFDFVLRRHKEHVHAGDLLSGAEHCMILDSEEDPLHVETVSNEQVRVHMTQAVQSITPDATLIEAARTMHEKHIHRLPVLDERAHVLGIISSLDIVAALVHSIEE